MKKVLVLLILIGLTAGGATWYLRRPGADKPIEFRMVSVARGDLVPTISATGTVQPVDVVDVGAQVVGRIRDLGFDPAALKGRKPDDVSPEERLTIKRIDYGSDVFEGTELAYIDDSVYRAQLNQAEAALRRAEADLLQFAAKLEQTKHEWQRAQDLHSLQLKSAQGKTVKGISDTEHDLARANYEVAEANMVVGRAAVEQAKATLSLAQTNVDYTIIKSPVKGVIIARRVNMGQTVVASLNAPSLFLIAKDLAKMQVWASVNEADIGQIRRRRRMPVRFTVDAYPGRTFQGTVNQIRLNATMTQNVVTYTVVIDFDNSDLTILPYLTANVQFEIDRRPDVLLVPNGALRWKPKAELVAAETRSPDSPGSPAAEGGGFSPRKPATAGREAEDAGQLWVKAPDGVHLRPIDVEVGQTDGTMTEVSGKEVTQGMEVVLGLVANGDKEGDDTRNPFGPPSIRHRAANVPKGPS